MLEAGIRAIVAAALRESVKRVLAVADAGVLDTARGGLRHDQPSFPEEYRAISRQHGKTWEALRESSLRWTLVCCPDLLAGERTGEFRLERERLPEKGTSISVEDTAGFLVAQIDSVDYEQVRVGIAY